MVMIMIEYYMSWMKKSTNSTTIVTPMNMMTVTVRTKTITVVMMILMRVIVAVDGNHVKAAIISPPLQMGEIMWYEKDFVAERVCEYIHLL